MPEQLHEVEPVPVEAQEVVIGPTEPIPGSSLNILGSSISLLTTLQKYSTAPIGVFFFLHAIGVVVVPAIMGPEAGNDVIVTGREIYQTKLGETLLLGSLVIHCLSGITLNLLRKYQHWKKYGKMSESSRKKKKLRTDQENEEVKDKNEGLGGLFSLFGAGSHRSLTYKWFGLSPIAFSGYITMFVTLGHVVKMRINPLMVDGDSSYVDLSYVSYAFHHDVVVMIVYPLFVAAGSYHMISGANRYLKLFSLRARRTAYILIGTLSLLGLLSCASINSMDPVVKSIGAKFQSYLDYM